MNTNLFRPGLVLALALTGCAPIKPQSSSNRSGPASPTAPEGAYAMASPVLMADTNHALPSQPEQRQSSDHSAYDQKKPAQVHEHHEH